MRATLATCSIILLVTACVQAAGAVAVKQFTRDEQIEIAKERNIIAGTPLYDARGNRITFPMTLAVFDDWERMRLGLK